MVSNKRNVFSYKNSSSFCIYFYPDHPDASLRTTNEGTTSFCTYFHADRSDADRKRMNGNYNPTAKNSRIGKQNHLNGFSQTNDLLACEDSSSFCHFLYIRHSNSGSNRKSNYTPTITVCDEMPKTPSSKVR